MTTIPKRMRKESDDVVSITLFPSDHFEFLKANMSGLLLHTTR